MATTQMSPKMDENERQMTNATASAIGAADVTTTSAPARQFATAGELPFEAKASKTAKLPAIDRERLHQPRKAQDGSPVLPSEWLDPEGDVYDSLA